MSAASLALASPALTDTLATLTQQAVGAWRVRWGLPAQQAQVSVAAWQEAGRPATRGAGRWSESMESAPCALFWPSRVEPVIAAALYPRDAAEPPSGESSLARESVRHVCAELRRVLLAAWRVEVPMHESGTFTAPSRWHAPVRVEITLAEDCRVQAVVPAARLRPPPRAQTVKRLAPADAQAFHRLPVQARLLVGRADVAVPDIAALQVGDVLVLDASIREPLDVQVPGCGTVLRACLGRVGGRRAAQLVSSKT